jgi:hypothetical protein
LISIEKFIFCKFMENAGEKRDWGRNGEYKK